MAVLSVAGVLVLLTVATASAPADLASGCSPAVVATPSPFKNWGDSGIPADVLSGIHTLKTNQDATSDAKSHCARLKGQHGRIAPKKMVGRGVRPFGGVKPNYQVVVLSKDLKIYRAYSSRTGHGNSKLATCLKPDNFFSQKIGGWWSFKDPRTFGTKTEYRKATSICTSWSLLTHVYTCTLKAGSVVVVGSSANAVSACKENRETLQKSPGCKDVDPKVWDNMKSLDGQLKATNAHQVYINTYNRNARDIAGKDGPLKDCTDATWTEVEAFTKDGTCQGGKCPRAGRGGGTSTSAPPTSSSRAARASGGRRTGSARGGGRFRAMLMAKLSHIVSEVADLEEAVAV